jgi:hypothetical protein
MQNTTRVDQFISGQPRLGYFENHDKKKEAAWVGVNIQNRYVAM